MRAFFLSNQIQVIAIVNATEAEAVAAVVEAIVTEKGYVSICYCCFGATMALIFFLLATVHCSFLVFARQVFLHSKG